MKTLEDEIEQEAIGLVEDEGAADAARIEAVGQPEIVDDNEPITLTPDVEYEMELEDGTVVACDMYGNRVDPESVTEEPVAEPEPARPAQEFHSPYVNTQLSQADIAEAEQLGIDPQLLGLIDRIADRRAMQAISAQEQQRAAARQIGISQEALDEFAPAMRQYESMVPANVRGTKEGAVTALLMAAGAEAIKTGDLGAVLQRMIPKAQAPAQPAPVRKTPDITPAQRSTTPRASSATVAPARVRGPKDAANESFSGWGVGGDVVSILQRERKTSRL